MPPCRLGVGLAVAATLANAPDAAALPSAIDQALPVAPAPAATSLVAPPQADAPPPAIAPPANEPSADVAPASNDFGDRTLHGHTFIFAPRVDSAFIATYVGVRAEARFVHVNEVVTRGGTFDLNVTGAAEALDFGIRFADAVGLRLSAGAAAVVGTNIPSVVYDGATYSYGFGVGVPVRLFRIESSGSQLALVPYFAYATGQIATLFPLFRAHPTVTLETILQGNGGELISTPIKTTTFGLNAAFAQALGAHFGLQAQAGLGRSVANIDRFNPAIQQRESQSTGDWHYNLGIAFTADAGPSFPVAGLVEWSVVRQPGTETLVATPETATAHSFTLGVYYSGRRNLQLGILAGWEVGEPRVETEVGSSNRPNTKSVRFDLRYVW